MSESKKLIELKQIRTNLRSARIISEKASLQYLQSIDVTNTMIRNKISDQTEQLITEIRNTKKPDLLTQFLAEYTLSSKEGLALMTLAETLLRVPDNKTRDQLFSDKISNKQWSKHLSESDSSVVNIATIALNVADMLIATGHPKSLRHRIKHALSLLSNPLMRVSTANVMTFFGKQFVFAEEINEALNTSKKEQDSLCSFDMLGEAAWTRADAEIYYHSYKEAIIAIGTNNTENSVESAHGISIKLSALHPKYDFMHKQRVMGELAPLVLSLAKLAKKYNIGLNIDAEEVERLEISLDVIEYVLQELAGDSWQGLGVVVQSYQKRAPYVLDWLYQCAKKYNIRIMVRLVKGAYWDAEIKNTQLIGESDYPVYTKKHNTDYAYLVCAQKLLNMRDRIYPQFASHNVSSLVAVYTMAQDNLGYEIQRLHGMGESLHALLVKKYQIKSRTYAPVGVHKNLLAYLVRRLLENGANSSFINQLFDEEMSPKALAVDVFSMVGNDAIPYHKKIPFPKDIYQPVRTNSCGVPLSEPDQFDALAEEVKPWMSHEWTGTSLIYQHDSQPSTVGNVDNAVEVKNPANLKETVGRIFYVDQFALEQCCQVAENTCKNWTNEVKSTAQALNKGADLFEEHRAELMALAIREAGKTYQDAVDEVREAVDFLRYYANLAEKEFTEGARKPLGVFVCISPWNFPLAIFTGQIAAALASGNCVIAKPAESTSLIACRAAALLHQAGISADVFQLTLGTGGTVGAYLTAQPFIAGVAFTGSTGVANLIKKTVVNANNAEARIIAETGGINAMVVDSTALPEQVARDVIDSAFKSAGQRCSALRLLLVQEDSADIVVQMIQGAMQELGVGDPKFLCTDCGPVINEAARNKLQAYVDTMANKGKLIYQLKSAENNGYFVSPAMIRIDDISELNEELFGPILHILRYKKDNLLATITALNQKGFGLTFGIHSRIEAQVKSLTQTINAGNVYINRNQIGAVVGSQPFGGGGLSGTGPKTGGFKSLHGFSQNAKIISPRNQTVFVCGDAQPLDLTNKLSNKCFTTEMLAKVSETFNELPPEYVTYLKEKLAEYSSDYSLPGPTGETNQLCYHPKGTVLCLGSNADQALLQTLFALVVGNTCITIISQTDYERLLRVGVPTEALQLIDSLPSRAFLLQADYQAVCWSGDVSSIEQEIIAREGEIIPVVTSVFELWRLVSEKVITTDTTASGGNASLLAL